MFVALTDVAVGLELAFYLAAAVFTHALAVVGPVVIMYVTWVKAVNHNS